MSKKRLIRLAIIISCLYLIVTTIQAIVALWRAGEKSTRRQQEVAVLEAEKQELQRQKREIETPFYWEKVARDQLGMSKPGEEVIIIPSELLVDPLPTASPDATPNWQKWLRLIL